MERSLILLAALVFPAVVFLSGAQILLRASGRDQIAPAPLSAGVADRKPLGQRLGYTDRDAAAYWTALEAVGRAAESRLLELDLIFPFFYGGALACSLLLTRAAMQRSFHAAWIMVPVAVVMIADWTENLVQLNQLARLDAGHDLQNGWIRVASMATTVKLLVGGGLFLGLTVLVIVALTTHIRAAPFRDPDAIIRL
jgi:hypothetical protein